MEIPRWDIYFTIELGFEIRAWSSHATPRHTCRPRHNLRRQTSARTCGPESSAGFVVAGQGYLYSGARESVKCALRCISFFPLGDYACGNSFSVRQSKSLKSYRRYVALPRSSPRKSNARDRARRARAHGFLLVRLISIGFSIASDGSFPSLEYCFMKRTVFAALLRELNWANRLGEDIVA